MAPVNKPTRLLSKEVNDTIFSKMVRPNCVSLVTTVATLFFFSGKDFIQQIVGVVCFECDLRSKHHYLRIYNLEDSDLFFHKQIGSDGVQLNSEDPLFFKIDFDDGTIGLQFQSRPEASMEAEELEKALRIGKIQEEMQPADMKNLDNTSVTVDRGIGASQKMQTLGAKSSPITTANLDFANDPILGEIMTLMGLEYNEVVRSPKTQANLRELISNFGGGTDKFLAKLKARPPDHKAMRAKAKADTQKQDKQVENPSMKTSESQSKTETKSHMPKTETVQSIEPRSVQKTSSVKNAPLSSLPSSSEAALSSTISTKMQQNRLFDSSKTAPISEKTTPTKSQQNCSTKLIQSLKISPQAVNSQETSLNRQQPIDNSPEKSSISSTADKSLQCPQSHPNANSGPQKHTKTVDSSPTISSPQSTLPPTKDDEIPIPELKYILPNVRRKVRTVAQDGLPESECDVIKPNQNPDRRNIGWVGKTVRPEQQKDDIPIPNLNGAERNIGRPCRNIHKKPEDESTRWTAEKLEKWQQDPVLVEILKLWGLKYEDFCKSEKWQDTLEALIAINGGAENLVQKRLEAIRKAEAEEEIPKPKINKIKIPACLNWAQEKVDDSPESESQSETRSNLPKAAEERPAQLSQEQTTYAMPGNQPASPSLLAQTMMHQNPSSVSPMSPKQAPSERTPEKKQDNTLLKSTQDLESQTTPARNQHLDYLSPTSVTSKTAVLTQVTPVNSLEPILSSIQPNHQALQSPTKPTKVTMQQKDSSESTQVSLSSHTPSTPITPKSAKSPLAPPKSSADKLPLSPNKVLHPVIFAKHPTTPKPAKFTHDEEGSVYFVRTPKNDKEESGKIQSTPIESIKPCPANATPRIQFDDDDDEYQKNANLRDNWQKRIQNRTPAASPSTTPAGSLPPECENEMLDAKDSGQKSIKNRKK